MTVIKIKNYISIKTGETFSCEEYANHGYGGLFRGKKDLYPYTIEHYTEYTTYKGNKIRYNIPY